MDHNEGKGKEKTKEGALQKQTKGRGKIPQAKTTKERAKKKTKEGALLQKTKGRGKVPQAKTTRERAKKKTKEGPLLQKTKGRGSVPQQKVGVTETPMASPCGDCTNLPVRPLPPAARPSRWQM